VRPCKDGRLAPSAFLPAACMAGAKATWPPWHNRRLVFSRPESAMNLLDFLIAPAHAAPAAAPGGGMGTLLFPIALIAIMYFLMIRPQMKRAKEHKAMVEKLARGGEVTTSGGIAGTITDIGDNFITVEIADNVRIRVQKGSVGNVLPKGTLKSA